MPVSFSGTETVRKPSVFHRELRRIRAFQHLISRQVDHEDVVAHVRDDGQLSGRYIFMIVMSCAIATLGLLLSSPAVIIGAMLISPLMGPIMLFGFSLSELKLSFLRKSAVSLVVGVLSALLISILIVKLSPLTDPTPEIVARTRPNFFDLLVAVFSGLAGGYAVIHRKGETIVGVAIATALMPPLAVTGYGIAVGSLAVAGGAFFLFMTNLLAIALSVTVLSRIYGFGDEEAGGKRGYWRSALVVGVFAALSIPLGLALRDIAYEARATVTVRDTILSPFADERARLADLVVTFPREAPVEVVATVRARERVENAEAAIRDLLQERLGRPISVSLYQVMIDEDKALERTELLQLADASIAAPLRAQMARLESVALVREREAEMRQAAPFAVSAADVNADERKAIFFAEPEAGFTIATYRALEQGLARQYGDWSVRIVPPVGELPRISFREGGVELEDGAVQTVEDCVWALQRWGATDIAVVGYASTAGELQRFNNQALAYQRAQAVANMLAERGFVARVTGEYRVVNQRQDERQQGYQRFQTVQIRPE